MKLRTFRCHICGKVENPKEWSKDCSKSLTRRRLCFSCNHWQENHLEDLRAGDYHYAIVDGEHYRLLPHTDGYFKGFGGHNFKFEFNDGTIVECDNVWFQGDMKREAHPHWREVMPDNAKIIQ